jgi:hypothetical protein
VDDFFQALKVAVVHIGLDEIGTRPLVHVPQGRDLELASNRGASRIQSEFGLSCGFLRKSPTPLSTYAGPVGLAVYPCRSGLV